MIDLKKNTWYADRGDVEALANLMCYYGLKDGAQAEAPDFQKAADMANQIKQMAEDGNFAAMEEIAKYHTDDVLMLWATEKGDQIRDILRLQETYLAAIWDAAANGVPEGMCSKAHLIYGIDVVDRMVGLLTKAAANGSSRACFDLYQYYGRGGFAYVHLYNPSNYVIAEPDEQVRNPELADYYLRLGAGYQDAYRYKCVFMIAMKYYRKLTEETTDWPMKQEQYKLFQYWIKEAADAGSYEAMEYVFRLPKIWQDLANRYHPEQSILERPQEPEQIETTDEETLLQKIRAQEKVAADTTGKPAEQTVQVLQQGECGKGTTNNLFHGNISTAESRHQDALEAMERAKQKQRLEEIKEDKRLQKIQSKQEQKLQKERMQQERQYQKDIVKREKQAQKEYKRRRKEEVKEQKAVATIYKEPAAHETLQKILLCISLFTGVVVGMLLTYMML